MSEGNDTVTGPPLFPANARFSQVSVAPPQGQVFDGEYRGFFPSDAAGRGSWRPTSSHWGGRQGASHEGLDIYAPYAPHPMETPVLALCDGRLHCRHMGLFPNKVGNRAQLSFRRNGQDYLFNYGHLSRFEGRDRTVRKGDVIGYAGCSGNADTKHECSRCGDCNVNSGHVHLMVLRGTQAQDPRQFVTLSLRFGPNGEYQAETACSQWTAAGGPGLPHKWTAPAPAAGSLRLRTEGNWRRQGRGRALLPEPFSLLDFDHSASLEASRDCYRLAAGRLEALRALPENSADERSEIRQFLKTHRDEAVAAMERASRHGLQSFRDRVVTNGQVIGLGAADEPRLAAGWLLRHLSVLGQMLWHTGLGPAIEKVLVNSRGVGDAGYETHRLIADGAAYAHLRSTRFIECGAGMGGEAVLSACDGGRNALHVTTDEEPATGGGQQATRHRVASITFGAGSLMHATISRAIARPSSTDPVEQAIAGYADNVFAATDAITAVHRLGSTNRVRLSAAAGSGSAATGRAAVLAEIGTAIEAALTALERVLDPVTAPADWKNQVAPLLLERVATANAALFDRMLARSRQPEGQAAVAPALNMLSLVPEGGE